MKYKLLQPLPGYETGTVFIKDHSGTYAEDGVTLDYIPKLLDGLNPDWFQPIDDTPDWEISTGNWKLENDLIEVWIKDPKQVPVISEAIRAVLAYIQTPWGGYHGLDQADTPQWGSEPEKAIVAARAAVQKGRD